MSKRCYKYISIFQTPTPDTRSVIEETDSNETVLDNNACEIEEVDAILDDNAH
jgi:hypothetical protein